MVEAVTHRPDADPPSALPRGTRLGEFEMLHVLGIGGFGIVYLALDHALEREVAVKEYMPESLAGRTETLHVSLRSASDAETFALGLRSFVNEARLLARFDHPSLVKVYRFWEANGTAYMAMPVYRGSHLKKIRAAMTQPPDEAWLRALLIPLLGAIERLHDEGVYHRDIAPDNIQIEADGRPVLLDFGAARRVISDRSQNLTAILKPAYAPIEQYAEGLTVRQGPWTDLYALGATLHYLLLGRPPAPATARAVHDDMVPLANQALPGCSKAFLACIDWMLAPRPGDRPQSVAQLRDALEGRTAAPEAAAAGATVTQADERTQRIERPFEPTIVVPAATPGPLPGATEAPAVVAQVPSRRAWWAGGLALLAMAGGAAFWMATRSGEPLRPVQIGAASAPVPMVAAPTPAPAVVVPPEPAPAASALVALVPAAPPLTAAAASAVPSRPPAPSSAAALARVVDKPAMAPTVTGSNTIVAQPKASADAQPRPVVVAPAPSPAPAEMQRPARTQSPVPAPAPAPAPPPPLASPTERCGSRVLFSLWICVERECGKPELRSHPECVKLRAEQAARAAANPGSR